MKNLFSAAVLVAMFVVAGCSGGDKTDSATTGGGGTAKTDAGGKPKIAFVTNNVGDFWTIAHKGTDKAQAELSKYDVEFQMPNDGSAAEQKRILDDLISRGVKGIAVSPVDPKNQTADLDALSEKAMLFTQDSDAPNSKRTCYIGTDNVEAGKMAGEEVKKAIPGGGKIMVFVGKADAENAKGRYNGLKDALKGSNITILDLRTDDTDRGRAKQNVADTLTTYPDIAGCVGLWSYNGPAIYNAVKEAKMGGKVKIVCFDEEEQTLAGIKDGTISATVVQQPFEFGYQSMKLMAKVLDGDKTGVPADKKIIVPTKVITKATVDEFKKNLNTLLGKK